MCNALIFKGGSRRSFLSTWWWYSFILSTPIHEWRHGWCEKLLSRPSGFLAPHGKDVAQLRLFYFPPLQTPFFVNESEKHVVSDHSTQALFPGRRHVCLYLLFVKSRLQQRVVSPLARLPEERIWDAETSLPLLPPQQQKTHGSRCSFSSQTFFNTLVASVGPIWTILPTFLDIFFCSACLPSFTLDAVLLSL